MLETDKAWDVFVKLEDCYFDRKPANFPEHLRSVDGNEISKATQSFMPAILEAMKEKVIRNTACHSSPAPRYDSLS